MCASIVRAAELHEDTAETNEYSFAANCARHCAPNRNATSEMVNRVRASAYRERSNTSRSPRTDGPAKATSIRSQKANMINMATFSCFCHLVWAGDRCCTGGQVLTSTPYIIVSALLRRQWATLYTHTHLWEAFTQRAERAGPCIRGNSARAANDGRRKTTQPDGRRQPTIM